MTPTAAATPATRPWAQQPYHRAWLMDQARALFDSFATTLNPGGGFLGLDAEGRPVADPDGNAVRHLHETTRMIYCFALGHLLGHPGSRRMVDHGMDYLRRAHRDPVNGGYWWAVDDNGPTDASKQAYGHAFVLLAASAAKTVGHPDADRLLADVTDVLLTRFWEDAHGAVREEFTADWQPLGASYRGQNSNMHLTEALMAAHEVTDDARYLGMAESIADLLIRRKTAENQWRLPEHFTDTWEHDRAYLGSEMFRPAGSTPGHWLEWSRLLVQLWIAGGRRQGWMPEAAAKLFAMAVDEGWDAQPGGFVYTVDWSGQPLVRDRMWWPVCEGIGATAFLAATGNAEFYQGWYRRLWDYTGAFILAPNGQWVPQLDERNQLKTTLFSGRPDIYHALQACLIPLFRPEGSLLREIARAG